MKEYEIDRKQKDHHHRRRYIFRGRRYFHRLPSSLSPPRIRWSSRQRREFFFLEYRVNERN